MVWPYVALALGSIVGYELLKSWLESQQSQQPPQEMQVTPALLVALILLAILIMRR